MDEVVRAKPDAALHRCRLAKLEVEPFGLDAGRVVVALEYPWRLVEVVDRLVDCSRPFFASQVATEPDTARPPGLFGEAGDFQDQAALFLREFLELLPVGQAKAGKGGVRRKRCG